MSNGTALGTPAAPVIDSFVTAVEERASHRLRTAPRLGVTSYSSSSFTSSTAVPPAPSPAAATLFDVPPLTLPPPAAFRIEPMTSIASNLMRLVEGHLPQSSPDDRTSTIAAALDEGLSLLLPAATAARRQELLASDALTALTQPGMAWLWASTLDATSSEVSGVNAMAISIVNSCSATAASLFAEAELQAALGF